MKVSFDFDDTLSTSRGQDLARQEISRGNDVYIISARSNKSGMMAIADKLNIDSSKVYATASNKAKIEKINELGIDRHYDNNNDVIRQIGRIGVNFTLSVVSDIKKNLNSGL